MKNRECILRYLCIVRKLQQAGKATFIEIRNYLDIVSSCTGNSYSISVRTFQRDIASIREIFMIDIIYLRAEKIYTIQECGYNHDVVERLIESMELIISLQLATHLERIIHLDSFKPLGSQHLIPIITVIKRGVLLQIVYNKDWSGQMTTRTIQPLFLKEYRRRWYLVAKRTDIDQMRTYALDRVVELIDIDIKAPKVSLKADYFEYSFGIYGSEQPIARQVILRFTPHAGRYIREAHLHHSQTILVDTDREFTVALQVIISYDLIMEILSYADDVEVVEPSDLRILIAKRCEAAYRKYQISETMTY